MLLSKTKRQWSSKEGWFLVCQCCCSVTQSYPSLCNPMDCSTPGIPVPQHLPDLAQTHLHWIDDAIQTSGVLFFFFWSLTFLKTWLQSGLFCPSQYPSKLQVIVIIPYRFFWALSLFLFFHCHPFIPLLSAVITYLLWNELCCPKINILKP